MLKTNQLYKRDFFDYFEGFQVLYQQIEQLIDDVYVKGLKHAESRLDVYRTNVNELFPTAANGSSLKSIYLYARHMKAEDYRLQNELNITRRKVVLLGIYEEEINSVFRKELSSMKSLFYRFRKAIRENNDKVLAFLVKEHQTWMQKIEKTVKGIAKVDSYAKANRRMAFEEKYVF